MFSSSEDSSNGFSTDDSSSGRSTSDSPVPAVKKGKASFLNESSSSGKESSESSSFSYKKKDSKKSRKPVKPVKKYYSSSESTSSTESTSSDANNSYHPSPVKKKVTGSSSSSSSSPENSESTGASDYDNDEDPIEMFEKQYKNKEIDVPPYKANGPSILIIIDSNLKDKYSEYPGFIKEVENNNRKIANGIGAGLTKTIIFATDDVEEVYDWCAKNAGVLRTYNGYPEKVRFVTNSNRASTVAGRGVDPKKAGNNFVSYVRSTLGLKDAAILVYYFSNSSCLSLKDEKNYVFVTNETRIAHPYIVYGRYPSHK